MNKSNIKKYVRSISFFSILIIIAFYFLLKGQDLNKLYKTVINANIKYVVIGIICMMCYSFGEAFNLYNSLKLLGNKVGILCGIKYALVGFFFSSITPSASGGQPMQIYYMNKDDINISTATLALLIEFSCFQLITIIYALVGFIYCIDFIKESHIGLLFFIGVMINVIILFGLLICIFSKKMSRKLIDLVLLILKKIKIKKIDKLEKSMNDGLENYQKSALLIKNNKLAMLKIIIITLVRVTLFYMIPYFVYRAFNLSGYKTIDFIFMQSVLYTTVSSLPLPGAVGISEGCFVTLFKKFIPESLISGAMLLNRGISFYLFVLFSGVMILIATIKSKKIKNTC